MKNDKEQIKEEGERETKELEGTEDQNISDNQHEIRQSQKDKDESDFAKATSDKQKKIENLEEQVKRCLADYQNLQRRAQEEKYQWIRQANKELLLKLLPVLDTLMLAQKHINDKGLGLSVDQFLKVLEAEGVKRIITAEKKFDPITMEAIGTGEGEKDKVVEEVRAGFDLYDNVLRSAQVIVGK
jgi:molecular chaperone GrpE